MLLSTSAFPVAEQNSGWQRRQLQGSVVSRNDQSQESRQISFSADSSATDQPPGESPKTQPIVVSNGPKLLVDVARLRTAEVAEGKSSDDETFRDVFCLASDEGGGPLQRRRWSERRWRWLASLPAAPAEVPASPAGGPDDDQRATANAAQERRQGVADAARNQRGGPP